MFVWFCHSDAVTYTHWKRLCVQIITLRRGLLPSSAQAVKFTTAPSSSELSVIFFRYIRHSWPRFPPVTRLFSFNPKHGLLWPAPTPHPPPSNPLRGSFEVFFPSGSGVNKAKTKWQHFKLATSKLTHVVCHETSENGNGLKKAHQALFFHLPKKKRRLSGLVLSLPWYSTTSWLHIQVTASGQG